MGFIDVEWDRPLSYRNPLMVKRTTDEKFVKKKKKEEGNGWCGWEAEI